MNYQQIFSGGEPLFFDCCAISGVNHWYPLAIETFKEYKDLKPKIIAAEIEHIKIFFPFITDPEREIYFTPKVIKEIQDFNKTISGKVEFLEYRKSTLPHAIENRRLLLAVKKAYEILAAVVPENVYVIRDKQKFEEHYKRLVRIGKKYEAKIKRESTYEDGTKKRKKRDNGADEEIITCALLHTLEQKKSCGVITRDKHLPSLFKLDIKYMLDNPGFEEQIDILLKSPMWVYDILREEITTSSERIEFYNAIRNRTIPGGLEEKIVLP